MIFCFIKLELLGLVNLGACKYGTCKINTSKVKWRPVNVGSLILEAWQLEEVNLVEGQRIL